MSVLRSLWRNPNLNACQVPKNKATLHFIKMREKGNWEGFSRNRRCRGFHVPFAFTIFTLPTSTSDFISHHCTYVREEAFEVYICTRIV